MVMPMWCGFSENGAVAIKPTCETSGCISVPEWLDSDIHWLIYSDNNNQN